MYYTLILVSAHESSEPPEMVDLRNHYRKRKERQKKEIKNLQEIELNAADQSEEDLALMLARHQMELEIAENEIDLEEMEICDDLIGQHESQSHDEFDQMFKTRLNEDLPPEVAAALFKVF